MKRGAYRKKTLGCQGELAPSYGGLLSLSSSYSATFRRMGVEGRKGIRWLVPRGEVTYAPAVLAPASAFVWVIL